MRVLKRSISAMAAGLAIVLVATSAAFAGEAWPRRPVRVVVPIGAASATDITARILADRLAERWKQPVVVENRPGADGQIGVAAFVGMHDDHALLFSPALPISVIPVVRDKVPYDPARDLVPIASAADTFGMLAVPASSNIGSLADLVKQARAQPGKLNCHATAGVFPYLLAGFFKSQNIEAAMLSYREQNLAVQDLAEGRMDFMLSIIAAVLPVVQAGKARFLAVTNRVRSPTLPDIPTVIEAGYPELAFEGFVGFFGPGSMAHALRDRIAADIAAVAADPVVAARFAAMGQKARASAPAEFAAMIESQRAQIADIVGRTGMKPTQ